MAVSLVVPVGALMPPPSAPVVQHPCAVRCASRPPPIAPPPIVVPVAVPVVDRADRMLLERSIGEIERLRGELGASDMALQAARSDAARARIEAWHDRCDAARRPAPANDALAASPGRPVPGTMAPRRDHSIDGDAAPGAAGAAPLVRTITLDRPRSLVDFFA